MSVGKAKLTQQQRFALQEARSVIRDMAHGWPLKELCEKPEVVCQKLSEILDEKFDFAKGETEDGT